MASRMTRYGPLLAALLVLYTIMAALLIPSIDEHNGQFTYALDDPYIHMAIAKNLARHGVWGVTRYEFSAASSSPLWTLLLAAIYRVIGVHALLPLALNLLLAGLLLALLDLILWRHGAPPLLRLALLIVLGLLAPLPALIVTGQEHLLQTVIVILFAMQAARLLSDPPNTRTARGETARLFVLAALLTAVRYEGLFLAGAAGLLLALRRQWSAALVMAEGALLPLLVFGAISSANGGFWLPNPVVVKTDLGHADTLGGTLRQVQWLFSFKELKSFYWTLFSVNYLHLTWVLLAGLVALAAARAWDRRSALLALFVITGLLHIRLARLAHFYRYEAYLMVWGLLALALVGQPWLRERVPGETARRALWAIPVAVAILFPALNRADAALRTPPGAMRDIYEQQVQMGRFVHTYYEGGSIAINDIGAVTFLADVHLLDVWGLGSNEVAHAMRSGTYKTARIESLAARKGVQIAIVYEGVFIPWGGVPENWVRVAEWTLPHKTTSAAYPTVTFYAFDVREIDYLARSLKEFSRRMPPGVIQVLYVDPNLEETP